MRRCPTCSATYRGRPTSCPLDGATLVETDDALLGTRVGGWLLRAVIAEGSQATVYRAVLGGVVGALKLYQPSVHLIRSEREASVQRRIRHPNVAALLAQGVTVDDRVYLVTELVDGQTLRVLLDHCPDGVPWQRALRLTQQAAAGLSAIHDRELVHRDVKPENLVIRASAGGAVEQIVLLDLGLALALDQARLTDSGMVWGSAPYMSPEQVAALPLDARSDLYSLGVVLYELLVGRRPFEAPSAVDVMQMHWTHRPESPLRRRPGLPPRVSEICLWMLARPPEQRPPSARVVQATLVAADPRSKNGKNTTARPADPTLVDLERQT